MNAGWYDENMGRTFPLVSDDTGLPVTTVVDFGCIMGPGVEYDDAADIVYLEQIRRDGTIYYFDFLSTAPALAGMTLTFCRSDEDGRFATEFAEATGDSEELCDIAPMWSGYLVTGDLTNLIELIGEDLSYEGDGLSRVVEPTLIRNLAKSSLDAVNLANGERTLATTPPGCREPCYDYERADIYVQATCLQGPLRFMEGHNNAITQNSNEGSLTFSARKGAGEGEPCGEVPLFDGETPPQGSSLLTGGLACDETIRSINGVNQRLFAIIGGNKVAVEPATSDPHQFRVIILDTDETPTDCDPPVDSEEPCDCGPAESE